MHEERYYALFSVAIVVVAHVKVTPCRQPQPVLQMAISYRHTRRRHRRRRDQSQPDRASHSRAVSSTCVSSDCTYQLTCCCWPPTAAALGLLGESAAGGRGDAGMVYSVDPSASRRQSQSGSKPSRSDVRKRSQLARFLPQSSRSSLAFGGAPMPNLNISIQFYRSP